MNKKNFSKGVIILAVTVFCSCCSNLSSSTFAISEPKTPVKSEKTQVKSIRCDNCPCNCLIKPNQTGECGQYKNVNGKLIPVKK